MNGRLQTFFARTKSALEVFALVFAGGYFLFQVLSGSFVVGMNMKASVVEAESANGYAISVALERTGWATTRLIDIRYAMFDAVSGEEILQERSFRGIGRDSVVDGRVRFGGYLRLAPNDRMSFSEFIPMPDGHSRPVRIEVLVVGKREWTLSSKLAQWKSSVVI